jgi:putative peptide zinc metalloprotease protein
LDQEAAGRAASPARRATSRPATAAMPQRSTADQQAAPGRATKPAFTPQDVPDRPKLAPNVVISGDMEESAFVDPPALVQKDGRFIQLTDLLFDVVKQIDGQRSVEDIAAAVKTDDGNALSADEVRELIAEKLMPVGLVQTRDGKVVQSQTARSPLALNMKMAMVSPRLLRALTWSLQALFLPFILMPMLAVTIAAVAWVILIHGIASSVHDAFYTPGLLLLTFGIIVISAAFHELGHAAGLRAGGKLPRAMGAGLYLVYPAFYTDVSENYQLKRWARVRTDLGGFYFNLIFATVMVALFFATGWEYLLFIVALVCLEIVHQLIPFVRLDGYWALADLLGIPDFFSQMGAFLRSIVPFRIGRGGRRLPRLRWWARIAFALYILIVVPVLAIMLFAAIKGFPRIAATAVDAFGQLAGQLGTAFAKGDIVLVAAIAVQLVFIALPTLGLGLIIFNLAKSLVLFLHRWGRVSPARAAIASLGSAAVVALLAFLWVPQLNVNVVGVRSGSLSTQVGSFQPIQQGETGGTIGQAVPPVDDFLRGVNLLSPSPSPSPTPSATPTAAPTSTPFPTDTPAPATAAPFVPPAATPARTPTPTPAPTPIP